VTPDRYISLQATLAANHQILSAAIRGIKEGDMGTGGLAIGLWVDRATGRWGEMAPEVGDYFTANYEN